MTFDLTGLPPTPAEMDAFLADESPDAFANVVDRLLASPRYGERWGRHWLDLARYADTSGNPADFPVPQARLYRDWVISAFNRDLLYEQFVREQIAGDHNGSVMFPRPSIGSWVSYGLGTENRNLPSFVVLAPALPYGGRQVWSSDFLPGCHQGTDATLRLYGLARGTNTGFGWQCLVARRLAERGVRFIELIDSRSSLHSNWYAHENMESHVGLAKNIDQPIAGLLQDFKLRGMLDETLVVWTTEFGRSPFSLHKDTAGRDHHSHVFTSWMAGGGVKAGMSHGESDEHGIGVAADGVHIHDFHATILHLLGFDHERLTYRHAGRDFRLTDVGGTVVEEILA